LKLTKSNYRPKFPTVLEKIYKLEEWVSD